MMLLKILCMINWLQKSIPSTSRLVSKTHHDLDKQNLEKNDGVDKRTPNTGGLVKNTDYNTKLTEIDIRYLALLV